ncbi:hypothetical protein V6R21_24000 [Limibacter armeniacum]|uniref:hypothetical protein n=1 Tax=Limibacter armeniacum TaxID=466084 RepID=UPI002FE68487
MKKLVLLFVSIWVMLSCQAAQAQSFVKNETSSMLEYFVLNNPDEAWNTDELYVFLATESGMSGETLTDIKKDLNSFIGYLKSKNEKYKKDESFLKLVFKEVQKRYLKSYTPVSTFANTMQYGKYDCLTGTMLYAVILKALDYDFAVYETNYHVYLKTQTEEGKVILFESTDPYKGFESSDYRISKREKGYALRQGGSFSYTKSIHQVVSLKELAGLQYFNLAVESFNNRDYDTALLDLKKTSVFYYSNRLTEIELLILASNGLPMNDSEVVKW